MNKSIYTICLMFFYCCFAQAAVVTKNTVTVLKEQKESKKRAITLLIDQPPKEIAEQAEMVLVSGYEPSGSTTNVEIDRPNSRVVLILTSYEKVRWDITATPLTKVVAVITSGNETPTLITNFETKGYLVEDLPYAYETENINFNQILIKLNGWFGVNKVDVFRGAYQLPSTQKIASLDTPNSKLVLNGINIEKPRSNFGFNLTDSSYATVKWQLTGPVGSSYMSYIDGQKFVLHNSVNKFFKVNDSGIEVVSKNQSSKQNFNLPDDFPRFSWVSGVAFDSKRNIVTIASYGGEGFLYRFDANKSKWIDYVSLNNQDILYLSYDKMLDRYVGWTTDGELTFLSPTGALLFGENVKDRIQGFGRLYDGGNSSVPAVVVRPRGNDIALIYINCQHVIRVWNYDLSTHSSKLTYKDTANMDISNQLKRANTGSCR